MTVSRYSSVISFDFREGNHFLNVIKHTRLDLSKVFVRNKAITLSLPASKKVLIYAKYTLHLPSNVPSHALYRIFDSI